MEEKYKFTVITVSRNDLEGLKKTVESVVNQTSDDFEYLVIDGNSTDGTKEYLETVSRIDYWVSEPDSGIYNAMNKAVARSKGKYCIFMNSGDTFYNSKVLKSVSPLLGEKDFYTGKIIVPDRGRRVICKPPKSLTLAFMVEFSLQHQATFIKTSTLKERPYNENFKIVSDWEKVITDWLCHDASYAPIDVIVSNFLGGGISNTDLDLSNKERDIVFNRLMPKYILDKIQEGLLPKTEVELKIERALTYQPVKRDLKLLRNSFKWLIHDLLFKIKN